jgi:hypothetical protein
MPTSTAPAPMLGGNIQTGGLAGMLGTTPPVNTMPHVVPQGGYGSIYAPNTVQPTAGVSNSNNFNFTPSGIDASGSYNTSDWLSVLGGLATGGIDRRSLWCWC